MQNNSETLLAEFVSAVDSALSRCDKTVSGLGNVLIMDLHDYFKTAANPQLIDGIYAVSAALKSNIETDTASCDPELIDAARDTMLDVLSPRSFAA